MNAGWIVLGLALAVVAAFELWAVATKHPTISQSVRRTFGRHRWWRPVMAALIGLLLWHLFLGGPL